MTIEDHDEIKKIEELQIQIEESLEKIHKEYEANLNFIYDNIYHIRFSAYRDTYVIVTPIAEALKKKQQDEGDVTDVIKELNRIYSGRYTFNWTKGERYEK